jgi:hypothetical protein
VLDVQEYEGGDDPADFPGAEADVAQGFERDFEQ